MNLWRRLLATPTARSEHPPTAPLAVPAEASIPLPLFNAGANASTPVLATPTSVALYRQAADGLIAVASVQAPEVALESYRLAANYGSSDAVAFYGATLFYTGLQATPAATWPAQIFDGLTILENAVLQGAGAAPGLLMTAVDVLPPAALQAWRERSGLAAQ